MPERVQKYLCAWEGGLLLIDEGFGPDVFVKHNDYAALESRLLAAEARVREVEAAFNKYGDHWDLCPAVTPRRKCNCGYDQARAILAREAGE